MLAPENPEAGFPRLSPSCPTRRSCLPAAPRAGHSGMDTTKQGLVLPHPCPRFLRSPPSPSCAPRSGDAAGCRLLLLVWLDRRRRRRRRPRVHSNVRNKWRAVLAQSIKSTPCGLFDACGWVRARLRRRLLGLSRQVRSSLAMMLQQKATTSHAPPTTPTAHHVPASHQSIDRSIVGLIYKLQSVKPPETMHASPLSTSL